MADAPGGYRDANPPTAVTVLAVPAGLRRIQSGWWGPLLLGASVVLAVGLGLEGDLATSLVLGTFLYAHGKVQSRELRIRMARRAEAKALVENTPLWQRYLVPEQHLSEALAWVALALGEGDTARARSVLDVICRGPVRRHGSRVRVCRAARAALDDDVETAAALVQPFLQNPAKKLAKPAESIPVLALALARIGELEGVVVS